MAAKKKHVPQRTCIACREVKDKRYLVRIVRTPSGQVIVDESGKANGRGAYLCAAQACWDKGLNHGILYQALKVQIADEDLQTLTNYAAKLSA